MGYSYAVPVTALKSGAGSGAVCSNSKCLVTSALLYDPSAGFFIQIGANAHILVNGESVV